MLGWLKTLMQKAMPRNLGGVGSGFTGGFVDAHKRLREPTGHDLIAQNKAMAWACAQINAEVCAASPPKLYMRQTEQKSLGLSFYAHRSLTRAERHFLIEKKAITANQDAVEILEHPLLELFKQVNPEHNAWDLWELTQLYLEVVGTAYWYLDMDPALGIPANIWILPSQQVLPWRMPSSPNLVDYYVYRGPAGEERFEPNSIIAFRMPDLRDPYRLGFSPLRASYEQALTYSEFSAFKLSRLNNHAIPDALLSPEEVIGEEERDRLEAQWNMKLRRGGAGRVIVTDSKMQLQMLQHSLGDSAALADIRMTREEIAFAFGIPQPYVSGNTNLANLQAARQQHGMLTIQPRIKRRDQKLNERLVPLYDPTGKLFLQTDDVVPEDKQFALSRRNSALQLDIMTLNEARAEMGLPPRDNGDLLKSEQAAMQATPAEPPSVEGKGLRYRKLQDSTSPVLPAPGADGVIRVRTPGDKQEMIDESMANTESDSPWDNGSTFNPGRNWTAKYREGSGVNSPATGGTVLPTGTSGPIDFTNEKWVAGMLRRLRKAKSQEPATRVREEPTDTTGDALRKIALLQDIYKLTDKEALSLLVNGFILKDDKVIEFRHMEVQEASIRSWLGTALKMTRSGLQRLFKDAGKIAKAAQSEPPVVGMGGAGKIPRADNESLAYVKKMAEEHANIGVFKNGKWWNGHKWGTLEEYQAAPRKYGMDPGKPPPGYEHAYTAGADVPSDWPPTSWGSDVSVEEALQIIGKHGPGKMTAEQVAKLKEHAAALTAERAAGRAIAAQSGPPTPLEGFFRDTRLPEERLGSLSDRGARGMGGRQELVPPKGWDGKTPPDDTWRVRGKNPWTGKFEDRPAEAGDFQ